MKIVKQMFPYVYLPPDELSQTEENTPHPLFQVQRFTAEGLPPKLHNQDLHKAKHKSDSNNTRDNVICAVTTNIFSHYVSLPAHQRCLKQSSRRWGS